MGLVETHFDLIKWASGSQNETFQPHYLPVGVIKQPFLQSGTSTGKWEAGVL